MQSIFVSPEHIHSPRWNLAFPQAVCITHLDQMPSDLRDTIIWVALHDTFDRDQMTVWISLGAKVVALTAVEDVRQAKQIIEFGASGYLHYLAAVPVLEQVAQVIQLGGLWLGADLMRQLVFATASILQVAETPADLSLLSPRELAVSQLVAAGKTNKEVAKQLDITERTVKAHLSAVFEKLQVRDRLQLVLVMSGK